MRGLHPYVAAAAVFVLAAASVVAQVVGDLVLEGVAPLFLYDPDGTHFQPGPIDLAFAQILFGLPAALLGVVFGLKLGRWGVCALLLPLLGEFVFLPESFAYSSDRVSKPLEVAIYVVPYAIGWLIGWAIRIRGVRTGPESVPRSGSGWAWRGEEAGPTRAWVSPEGATTGLRSSKRLVLVGLTVTVLVVVSVVLGIMSSSTTPAMTTARTGHTATLLADGRVLLAGGDAGTNRFGSAELYDPKTGAFSPTGSMTTGRIDDTATLLPDGRVLIAGGYAGYTGMFVLERNEIWWVETYDPRTGTFTPTGSMSTPRTGHTATLLGDGRVLLTGGDARDSATSAETYDPRTGTFTPTGSMSTPRTGHTATLLGDGRVLLIGGPDASRLEPRLGRDCTTPRTGTLQHRPARCASPRTGHTATLLSDGRVLVAGARRPPTRPRHGRDRTTPGPARSAPTGSMSTPRTGHTATLLGDGRVLLAGGSGRLATRPSPRPRPTTPGPARSPRPARCRLLGRSHTATLLARRPRPGRRGSTPATRSLRASRPSRPTTPGPARSARSRVSRQGPATARGAVRLLPSR